MINVDVHGWKWTFSPFEDVSLPKSAIIGFWPMEQVFKPCRQEANALFRFTRCLVPVLLVHPISDPHFQYRDFDTKIGAIFGRKFRSVGNVGSRSNLTLNALRIGKVRCSFRHNGKILFST